MNRDNQVCNAELDGDLLSVYGCPAIKYLERPWNKQRAQVLKYKYKYKYKDKDKYRYKDKYKDKEKDLERPWSSGDITSTQ